MWVRGDHLIIHAYNMIWSSWGQSGASWNQYIFPLGSIIHSTENYCARWLWWNQSIAMYGHLCCSSNILHTWHKGKWTLQCYAVFMIVTYKIYINLQCLHSESVYCSSVFRDLDSRARRPCLRPAHRLALGPARCNEI